jgi:hypothetical protein
MWKKNPCKGILNWQPSLFPQNHAGNGVFESRISNTDFLPGGMTPRNPASAFLVIAPCQYHSLCVSHTTEQNKVKKMIDNIFFCPAVSTEK